MSLSNRDIMGMRRKISHMHSEEILLVIMNLVLKRKTFYYLKCSNQYSYNFIFPFIVLLRSYNRTFPAQENTLELMGIHGSGKGNGHPS